jgi:hypothetical protein
VFNAHKKGCTQNTQIEEVLGECGRPLCGGVGWVVRALFWRGMSLAPPVYGSAAKNIHRGTREIEEFTEQARQDMALRASQDSCASLQQRVGHHSGGMRQQRHAGRGDRIGAQALADQDSSSSRNPEFKRFDQANIQVIRTNIRIQAIGTKPKTAPREAPYPALPARRTLRSPLSLCEYS